MVLHRRDFLKWLGAASCVSGCTAIQEPSRKKGPNFLVLLTDDQRFDALGAMDNPAIQTPNMDRLAAGGTTFTHTYIMGSPHGAVCMPSRAMLLTGKNYFNLPDSVVESWSVPEEEQGDCPCVTFPELLRHAGYDTFGTGKWHNGKKLYAKGFTHGGKIFFGGMSDHLKVPLFDFDPTGRYDREKQFVGNRFSSELFSNEAIDFLNWHDPDRPFLMYVSYTAPHDPRMAPESYAGLYPPEEIEVPENYLPDHPFDNGELKVRDENLAPHPRTPAVVQEHIAAYYAMITHLDAQIGRVLDALEASGEKENTIIVFASDNGLAVGQHGLMGKQNLYEHSARVPLIVSGPGVPRGQRSDALCYLHDVFPTICDLAGMKIPESVETKSLVPLMEESDAPMRDAVYLSYSNGPTKLQRGVRTRRWKLIRYYVDGEETVQLFDLENDPLEKKNLSGEPSVKEWEETMNQWLRELAKASGDPVGDDTHFFWSKKD